MVILQGGVGRNTSKSLPSPARGSPSLQSLPNTPIEFQGMEQMIQRWRNLEAQKIQRLNQAEPFVKMREQKEYDELRRRFLESKQRGKTEIKEQRITSKSTSSTVAANSNSSSSSISTLASPHSTFSLNASSSIVTSSNLNEEPNGTKRKAAAEPWPAFNKQTEKRIETSCDEFSPAKRRPRYAEPTPFHSEPSPYANNNLVQNAMPVGNNYPDPSNSSLSTDSSLTVSCSSNELLNLTDIPDVWGDLVNNAQVVDDSLISASLKDVFGVPPTNYSFSNAPVTNNYSLSSSSDGTAVNHHQQQQQLYQQSLYAQNFNNFRPPAVQIQAQNQTFNGTESSQMCLLNVPQQGSFQASKQLERMAAQQSNCFRQSHVQIQAQNQTFNGNNYVPNQEFSFNSNPQMTLPNVVGHYNRVNGQQQQESGNVFAGTAAVVDHQQQYQQSFYAQNFNDFRSSRIQMHAQNQRFNGNYVPTDQEFGFASSTQIRRTAEPNVAVGHHIVVNGQQQQQNRNVYGSEFYSNRR